MFAGDAEGFREEYLHQEAVEVDPVSFRFFLHSPCSSNHRIISQECHQFLGQNAHLVLEHQAGLHHNGDFLFFFISRDGVRTVIEEFLVNTSRGSKSLGC